MTLGKRCIAPALLAIGFVGSTAGAGPEAGINVNVVNPPTQPVPVTGTLGVSGSVTISNPASSPVPVAGVIGTVPLLPDNAFSYPPRQLSLSPGGALGEAPDPSGTQYAITSVTLTNGSGNDQEIVFRAVALEALAINNNCAFPFNQVATADGPRVFMPAKTTVHLAFPQPFVTAPVVGPKVCLVAGGGGFVPSTWSAVGYKILP